MKEGIVWSIHLEYVSHVDDVDDDGTYFLIQGI